MRTPASLKNKVAIVGVGESDIGKVPAHDRPGAERAGRQAGAR